MNATPSLISRSKPRRAFFLFARTSLIPLSNFGAPSFSCAQGCCMGTKQQWKSQDTWAGLAPSIIYSNLKGAVFDTWTDLEAVAVLRNGWSQLSSFMLLFSVHSCGGNECGSSISGTLPVSLQRVTLLKLYCFCYWVTEQWWIRSTYETYYRWKE